MNALLVTILSLSLSGTIFIAILFLLKPLIRIRISKKWQYYVWLIVIVRLLLPFSLEINLIGSLFDEISQTNVPVFLERNIFPERSGAIGGTQVVPTYSEVSNLRNNAYYALVSTWGGVSSYLWLLWLIVAIALFVRKVTIYQGFVRYIKAGRVPVSEIEDLERFGQLVEQANIRSVVGFYTNSLISSPLLIGFFRPFVVLPTLNISESDFKYTIIHELTHCKRGDMFYKWLVQFTICLHWFNPAVYWMSNEINNACEFSCDESVIKKLDYRGMRAYGDTLLNALGIGGDYKSSLSALTLNENKKILKERLDMLMKFRKPSRLSIAVMFFATMFLGIGTTVAGAYTSSTIDTNRIIGINAIYTDNYTKRILINLPEVVLGEYIFIDNLQFGDTFTYNIAHEGIQLTTMVTNSIERDSMNHIPLFVERWHESNGIFTVGSTNGKYLLLFPSTSSIGQSITGTILIERSPGIELP